MAKARIKRWKNGITRNTVKMGKKWAIGLKEPGCSGEVFLGEWVTKVLSGRTLETYWMHKKILKTFEPSQIRPKAYWKGTGMNDENVPNSIEAEKGKRRRRRRRRRKGDKGNVC